MYLQPSEPGATALTPPKKAIAAALSVVLALGLSPLGQAPAKAYADEPESLGVVVVQDGEGEGDGESASSDSELPTAVNGVITLDKDYTVASAYTVNNSSKVVIDLNGHNLTFNGRANYNNNDNYGYNVLVDNGDLTLQGKGTVTACIRVVGSETANDNYTSALTIEKDVQVVSTFNQGISIGDSRKNAYGIKVNIAGAVKTNGNGSAIWVMGNIGHSTESATAMNDSNAPQINIKSGATIGGDTADDAINMNGACVVNVEDGASIIGGQATMGEAISIKRGTLNVNGGTFSAAGDKYKESTVVGNLNGGEDTGAVISAVSTYNGYGTIAVNINGGDFVSAKGDAVLFVCASKKDASATYNFNSASLSIKGGTFTSANGSEAVSISQAAEGTKLDLAITGGTFSTDVKNLLTSEYTSWENTTASPVTYTVVKKEDADAATAVITTLNALTTSSDAAAVKAARAAHDALTADQKALVTADALKKLTDAEAAVAAAEKAAEDAAKAAADKKAVEEAAAAQKAAEEAAAAQAAQKAAADKKAADDAIAKINAIDAAKPETVSAARTAYDALTADQKKLVSAETLKKLTDVEAAVAAASAEPSVGDTVEDVAVSDSVTVDVAVTSEDTVSITSGTVKSGSTLKIDKVEVDGKSYTVTAIAAGAFKNTKAAKVTIGNSVTSIGANAFANASKLTTVTVGKKVKTIGKGAFSGAKKLKSVTVGAAVKSVGKNAFKNCKKLKTITVKSGKLTKASCKNLVSGSKISKVKLSGKAAKKMVKKYKKWFPKGVKVA